MKLIYIDDSGNTGKKLDDDLQPLFLLGGFIIDENDWKKVDKSIEDIKQKYELTDIEIHAIDVINGKKGTPYDFEQQFDISPYLLAFSYILQISDSYLIEKDNNGILILDEQDEWKKPANKTFNILRTIVDEPEIKIEKLLDRSFFVDSSESNMVQLADVVAYNLKRYFECDIKDMGEQKQTERKNMYKIIESNIYKPKFDYGKHTILKWLEDNIGNQAKDKQIG